MSLARIKYDVRWLTSLMRFNAWNSIIFKGKTYFYKKPICVCLPYAIPIYYLYIYICSWVVCGMYMHVFMLQTSYIYIHILLFCMFTLLCYDWSLILYFQLFIFLLRKNRASGIVQVRSDAGWLIVSYRYLNLTNDLFDLNCMWLLIGWP